jgi:hypothetical protein
MQVSWSYPPITHESVAGELLIEPVNFLCLLKIVPYINIWSSQQPRTILISEKSKQLTMIDVLVAHNKGCVIELHTIQVDYIYNTPHGNLN